MQLGRLETMEQGKIESDNKLKIVTNKDKITHEFDDTQHKNIEHNSEIKLEEVLLDNLTFGFDSENKVFFLRKNVNGQTVFQFPTEQIIKMRKEFKENILLD